MIQDIVVKKLWPDSKHLSDICNVINTSWQHDYDIHGSKYYTKDYLECLLNHYHEKKPVVVGAFDKSKDIIVGINAALPRTISLGGKKHHCALSVFLSVLPDYRRSGIGRRLVESTLSGLDEQGIHLNFTYIDPRRTGLRTYKSISKLFSKKITGFSWLFKVIDPWNMSFGIDMNTILKGYFGENLQIHFYHDKRRCLGAKTFRFATRTLNNIFEPVNIHLKHQKNITKYGKSENEKDDRIVDSILNILNSFSSSFKLSRIWSKDELVEHLNSPYSHTLVFTNADGFIRGFINYIEVRIMFGKPLKFCWLDNIDLGGLTNDEAQALLFSTTNDARKFGCVAMVAPNLKYNNDFILMRNGFIPFTRKFELWLFSLKSISDIHPMKKCYVDVR